MKRILAVCLLALVIPADAQLRRAPGPTPGLAAAAVADPCPDPRPSPRLRLSPDGHGRGGTHRRDDGADTGAPGARGVLRAGL